jgi:hypothetical protein
MTGPTITDETLMALADGELAPEEAVAVRSRISSDPDLATRFATFVETRMLLQEPIDAAAAATTEATPKRLVDAIHRHDAPRHVGGPVRTSATARWRLPIAAAIAFAFGGLVGSLVTSRDAGRGFVSATDIFSVPAVRSAVVGALDRTASGNEVSWSDPSSGLSGRVLMVASQRLNDGTACREYEVSYRGRSNGSVIAASCRHDDAWRTEIAVFRPDADKDYRPAGGAAIVEQYLTDLGSSGTLSNNDEKASIATGWRTQR